MLLVQPKVDIGEPDISEKAVPVVYFTCLHSLAIALLSRVIKIVAPKKAKLSEAETELANQMDKLNEKRAQLQQVISFLQRLFHFVNSVKGHRQTASTE